MGLTDLSRIAVAVGCGVATVGLASVLVVACSSGSTQLPAQGTDGGPDATRGDADAAAQPEVQAEASDGNVSDIMSFVDVGDVAISVPTLGQFPHAVDEAYCTRLAQCCTVDGGGQWNQEGEGGCVPTLDEYGGAFSIAAYNAALDSGLVVYDASTAYTCLHDFLSLNCGTITSAAFDTVRNNCFAAMQGTLPAGQGPCINALECVPGNYCQVGSDASTGTCQALKTQGQPCSDKIKSTECTYLGEGTPALYCSPGDGGVPTCQPALPSGANCNLDQWCQSDICAYPTCSDTTVFSDPGVSGGTCASYTLVAGDAGSD